MINSLSKPEKVSLLLERFRDVCLSSHYSEGGWTRQFEALVSDLYSSKYGEPVHAVAVSNAGAGLFALSYLLVPRGDRVLAQNNTFYASGAMFQLASNARVSLVDSASYCPSMGVDPLQEEVARVSSVDEHTPVVVLTHIGGWLAKDYSSIASYCQKNGLMLLEDAAHALGVFEEGLGAGFYGKAAVFSFYPTKAVPIGEGGMVITKDWELAKALREFRSYGKYWDSEGVIRYRVGMNLRMDEWSACVGVTQMEGLQQMLEARQRDAGRLGELVPCLLKGQSNYYKYPIKHNPRIRQEAKSGRVYSRTDQLREALGQVSESYNLDNSLRWADSHECLWIGEGMFDEWSDGQLKNWIWG